MMGERDRGEGKGEGKGIGILPLIRIPIIRLRIYTFSPIRRHQLVVILHAHTPPDNLPDPRHETVN